MKEREDFRADMGANSRNSRLQLTVLKLHFSLLVTRFAGDLLRASGIWGTIR
jgi:hypothetical protein